MVRGPGILFPVVGIPPIPVDVKSSMTNNKGFIKAGLKGKLETFRPAVWQCHNVKSQAGVPLTKRTGHPPLRWPKIYKKHQNGSGTSFCRMNHPLPVYHTY